MDLGLAHAQAHGYPLLVGSCVPEHLSLYAKYGFERLPRSQTFESDVVGQLANTVVCDTTALPSPTDARVAELRRELQGRMKR